MPSQTGTIKWRVQATQADNAAYTISSSEQTDSFVVNSAGGNIGGLFVYDTGNTDKWGIVNSVASGQVLASSGAGSLPAWTASPTVTSLVFSGGSNLVGSTANVIEQYNGTNAQDFRIFNTRTDAANNEYVRLTWSGNKLFFGTVANGTGSARAISFTIGSNSKWEIDTSGNLVAFTDNNIDIGQSGANRPRNVYIAGTLTLSGGTLLATSAALTNGAAANTGTLTNAPAAGNPTKWIPVNDNGTTRYIPAW